MSHALCPHCGHNFKPDAPVAVPRWRIDPLEGKAYFRRRPVVLRASWARLLHSVAAASPSIVGPDALLNRISHGENVNLIRVMFCQMKRNWPASVPWPIETVHGHGYRWAG